MNTELDILPNSIRQGLEPNASMVTYEGLSTHLGKNEKKNDLLLPIYQSDNNSGNNFDVMFFNHDKFNETYEVNPHKINFTKDRETLCIGKTIYTADIRRYVKEVKTTFSLKLNKGVKSPLFIPYVDDVFIVLKPLDVDDFDNPPLILDNDDDNYKGSSIGEINNAKLQTYLESRNDEEDYDKSIENLSHLYLEDEGLQRLFTPTETTVKEEVFNEVDGQTVSLVLYDHKRNDPNYIARKEFLNKFPNAGNKMSMLDYDINSMTPPTNDLKDLLDRSPAHSLGEWFNSIATENINPDDYTIKNDNQDDTPDSNVIIGDTYIATELENSKNVLPRSKSSSRLKLDRLKRKVFTDDTNERYLTDDPIEINGVMHNRREKLTDEDIAKYGKTDFFAMPDEIEMKPIDDKTATWEHKMWSICKYLTPDDDIHDRSKFKSDNEWRNEAKWTCKCNGNIQYHLDKEIEERGIEISSKHAIAFDKPLFDLPSEPDEEGIEISEAEFNRNIFEVPKLSPERLARLQTYAHEHSITSMIIDGDKITFFEPKEPKSKVESLMKQLEVYEKGKQRQEALRNSKPSDVKESVILTQVHTADSKFVYEAKSRKLDFLSYELKTDDLINFIPEMVRRGMVYAGTKHDNNIDVYTMRDNGWNKNGLLDQSIIMANWDKLHNLLREYRVNNAGLDLTNDRQGDWLVHGSHKYPLRLIEPFVKDTENKHGLIIGKQVTTDEGTSLYIPYGDVTLAIAGISIS